MENFSKKQEYKRKLKRRSPADAFQAGFRLLCQMKYCWLMILEDQLWDQQITDLVSVVHKLASIWLDQTLPFLQFLALMSLELQLQVS